MGLSEEQKQIGIGIAAVVIILFLIGIIYWFFMRNSSQYGSITATLAKDIVADYAFIDGARWMDTTNKNAPGMYQGFAQITTSRAGNVPGYITNGTVTDRYVELPTTPWTSLQNGYQWTLNTWMETRSLTGAIRYFHGINSVKQNMDQNKTFYMVATSDGNIHPYTPDVRKLVNGKDATFTLDAPFMLTVVRNGRNFLSGPDWGLGRKEPQSDRFTRTASTREITNPTRSRIPACGMGTGYWISSSHFRRRWGPTRTLMPSGTR